MIGVVRLVVRVVVEEPALYPVKILARELVKVDVRGLAMEAVQVVVVVLVALVAMEAVQVVVVVLVQVLVRTLVKAIVPEEVVGKMANLRTWQDGLAKTITFIVTKDCQLACKYCYLVGKNAKEQMSFDTAKSTIDYILNDRVQFNQNSVIWDFIGGEPFLEIDLIDKVCDYIKLQLFEKNHKWFDSYRFSFSTNGVNYHESRVQRFIEKNQEHLSIGITIDGTKQKHDLNRIYKNSKGSYDDVVRNIPLWLSQFPNGATKVTISSLDIPFIKESVLHLYSLGIKEVNINVVFENVWEDGDDILFESQLTELADAIIDGDFYKEYDCSFFQEFIGKPLDKGLDNQNWCGAGMMLAVDASGMFYPCTRFAQFSLREKKAVIIGNVNDGINQNFLRPFLTLDRCTQSNAECIDCEVASGCSWCQAENYDAAKTSTIYQRSIAICKMHKARVRANNYYWNKFFRKLELEFGKENYQPKQTSVIC